MKKFLTIKSSMDRNSLIFLGVCKQNIMSKKEIKFKITHPIQMLELVDI